MKKNLFKIILTLCSFSFLLQAACLEQETASGSRVFSCVARTTPFQARILPSSSDLMEEEKGFKESFLRAYTTFTAEDLFGTERTKELGGTDKAKESALAGAFQEEREALGTPGISHVRLETKEGSLIGFFSVEEWDKYVQKPAGFPEHSIYVRQFYILPSFQKQGIGKVTMYELLRSMSPSTQHMYIATRRINEGAKALYEGLGFKERVESLHGLPPEKYISYELHLGS